MSVDKFILVFDKALKTSLGGVRNSQRASPAANMPEPVLEETARNLAGRLMRVNHCGEVCAQALYQGQALTARDSEVAVKLNQAAEEETDHLAWCEQRLTELNTHASYLNPAWYLGSFTMGAIAGLMGDKINLGFVAATEDQVCQHLDEHLLKLPTEDTKSHAVLTKMREDEAHHRDNALDAGGARFPALVKTIMTFVSRGMTRSSYWF